VSQVLIHTPGLGLGRGDGDALLGGIGKEIVTAGETLIEDGVAPRGDDLDGGLQGVEGKLEANLVVTLTSAAVGNGEAALALLGIPVRYRPVCYQNGQFILPGQLQSGHERSRGERARYL
jgi:hypothetical protein